MRTYILRRLLLFVPVLIGVSLVIFIIMRVAPGNVAEVILGGESGSGSREAVVELQKVLGLDRPLPEQYITWVWGLVRLDPGKSLWNRTPILDEIKLRFPVTLELAVMSATISLLLALPIGVISAIKQDTWVDYLFRVISISGLALPGFWLGTLLVMALSINFNWLPPLEWVGLFKDPIANLKQIIWPALVLGFALSAITSRMTRSQTLEVLRQDYVRTAWSKGLTQRVIVLRHVLKNALLPIVTIVGLEVAGLLGGTVLMERIFVLPGMGSTLIEAIQRRDYPVVQTFIVVFALVVMCTNLVVDTLYAWLDPRIKYR